MYYKKFYFLFYAIFLMLSSPAILSAEPKGDSSRRLIFLNNALGYLNTPYRYGGTTRGGMDCSGFVYRSILESFDMSIPRSSAALSHHVEKITDNEVQPGDLLFFNTAGTISHTGIYLGAGQFIHAASDGSETGVIISRIQEPYWQKSYRSAGRITAPEKIFTAEKEFIPLFSRTEANCPLHSALSSHGVHKK